MIISGEDWESYGPRVEYRGSHVPSKLLTMPVWRDVVDALFDRELWMGCLQIEVDESYVRSVHWVRRTDLHRPVPELLREVCGHGHVVRGGVSIVTIRRSWPLLELLGQG